MRLRIEKYYCQAVFVTLPSANIITSAETDVGNELDYNVFGAFCSHAVQHRGESATFLAACAQIVEPNQT